MRYPVNAAHIIIDYVAATDNHGFLDFGEFVAVWIAAQALAEVAADAGLEPEDAEELLLRLD